MKIAHDQHTCCPSNRRIHSGHPIHASLPGRSISSSLTSVLYSNICWRVPLENRAQRPRKGLRSLTATRLTSRAGACETDYDQLGNAKNYTLRACYREQPDDGYCSATNSAWSSSKRRIMADVCISYARSDAERVQKLRDILAKYFSVWWDRDITAGDYRQHIEEQLRNARCVVPVWSAASRESRHVTDEVELAIAAGITVLPVRIEPVAPPMGFGGLHMIDLLEWEGDEAHPEIRNLVSRLQILAPKQHPDREGRIYFRSKQVDAPCMVFSVSSHETQIAPLPAVQALSMWHPAAVLVSAYDIANADKPTGLIEAVRQCGDTGSMVLLDSGNYEAYRKKDDDWSRDRLYRVWDETPCDGAFTFDNTRPPNAWEEAIEDVLRGYEQDMEHTSVPLIPILHAPLSEDSRPRLDVIPLMAKAVANELKPPLIAVPERELGDGLLVRARTVHAIRTALDEAGWYQPLHLLGTGNHVTAAVLAAAGADCFDGLEWCRTVADDQVGGLYHFQHYDLVAWQSKTSTSKLLRGVAEDDEIPYAVKVAFHNLEFFDRWMEALRTELWAGKADRFLTARIPGGLRTITELTARVPEVFS